MSRKQPNAYTKEDIDTLLDAAQVKPDSQLRDKTAIKDVLVVLTRLNGMSMVDCMPTTNPGTNEPYTVGSFNNALLPHVLPSYKLTPQQLETIGKLFSPDRAMAKYERLDSRAEREKFARALKDTYGLEITVPEPKPRTPRSPRTAPLKVSIKDREIFSFIRAQLIQDKTDGVSLLFPKDMGLKDWLDTVLKETGKSYADIAKDTSNEGAAGYESLIRLDKLDYEIAAENIARIVQSAPDGIKGLQLALALKAASAATGAAPNV